MISRRNRERLGDLLAVVVAILLASVIVALAGTAHICAAGTGAARAGDD